MIDFVKNNWSYILSGLFGFVMFASIIVKITPNQTDDKIINMIINFFDKFSIAKTEMDKELIKIAKKNLNED